jgi:hypothetical protein
MSFSETQCYIVAQEIEQVHAMEMARRSKIPKKWADFYDPHAATEMGALIYNRLCPRKVPQSDAGAKG